MDEARVLAQELIRISADLLYKDAHHWSQRPCSTCRTISDLLGFDFGCIRYEVERRRLVP